MTKLALFCRAMQVVAVLCGLAQVGLDSSSDNLVSVALVVSSSFFLYEYLLQSNAVVDTPVSSLALIGFNSSACLVSLIAQTLSAQGLVHLLRAPQETFAMLSGLLVMAILVHAAYRQLAFFMALRQWFAVRVFEPVGALHAPPVWMIWVMAAIGAASTFKGGAAYGDVGGKFLQALSFLQWLPFAIPIYFKKHGRDYCDMKLQWPLLLSYVLLLAMIGLTRNARQLMLIGPFQAAVIYFLWTVQQKEMVGRWTTLKAAGLIVCMSIGVSWFSDLSTAMTIARDQRETASRMEVVNETIALLSEPEKLNQFRLRTELAAKTALYDEAYLSNPVLSRLSETKFHDNMFFYALSFNQREDDRVWTTIGEKLLTTLPQPFLDAMKINIEKAQYGFSMGDYFRYLNEGEPVLGGYATGSMWADMLAVFGVWMPFIACVLMLWMFLIFDSLSYGGQSFVISPIVLASTFVIFEYGLGADSLVTKIQFILRDWPQKIVLYLLIYHVLALFFGKGRAPK